MFTERGRYNFSDGTRHTYGEISVKDNAAATTLAAASLVKIDVFDTDGWAYKTTPDAANDCIQVIETGIYHVLFDIQMNNNAAQSHIIDVSLFLDGAATEFLNIHANKSLTGGVADVDSMSASGIVQLNAGERICLYITTDSVSDRDVTIEDASLNIVRLDA